MLLQNVIDIDTLGFNVLVSLCCYNDVLPLIESRSSVLVSLCCYKDIRRFAKEVCGVLVSLCCYHIPDHGLLCRHKVLVSLCCYLSVTFHKWNVIKVLVSLCCYKVRNQRKVGLLLCFSFFVLLLILFALILYVSFRGYKILLT